MASTQTQNPNEENIQNPQLNQQKEINQNSNILINNTNDINNNNNQNIPINKIENTTNKNTENNNPNNSNNNPNNNTNNNPNNNNQNPQIIQKTNQQKFIQNFNYQNIASGINMQPNLLDEFFYTYEEDIKLINLVRDEFPELKFFHYGSIIYFQKDTKETNNFENSREGEDDSINLPFPHVSELLENYEKIFSKTCYKGNFILRLTKCKFFKFFKIFSYEIFFTFRLCYI